MSGLYQAVRRAGTPVVTAVYRVVVEEAGRIPATGPCVLAANHESQVDPVLLSLTTPRTVHYMAKDSLWRVPLLGPVLDGLGCFPVARGAGDLAAIERGESLLRAGEVVGVFPQGTSLPFPDRRYRRGAARLALATGAPLVPVCLVNTEKALRPHRPKVGLPSLRAIVGEPIAVEPQEPTAEAADELTRRLETEILRLREPYGAPAHVTMERRAA